jgi:hypothetical protein
MAKIGCTGVNIDLTAMIIPLEYEAWEHDLCKAESTTPSSALIRNIKNRNY